MADTTKMHDLNKGAFDQARNIAKQRSEWRIMTGMASDILVKGYAISDRNGVRIHSLKRIIEPNLGGAMFIGILNDRSAFEKKVAGSHVPGLRLLRRGAELMGELSKKEDETNWDMTIYGGKSFYKMNALLNELSNRYRVRIDLRFEESQE